MPPALPTRSLNTMLHALKNYTIDGRPATQEERLAKIREFTDSGTEARISCMMDMAYETFTVGNAYIEEVVETMRQYGFTDSKMRTLANNLMQSFDALDKYMIALHEADTRNQLCNNIDVLREVIDALCENKVVVERGPYYQAKLFLPTKNN